MIAMCLAAGVLLSFLAGGSVSVTPSPATAGASPEMASFRMPSAALLSRSWRRRRRPTDGLEDVVRSVADCMRSGMSLQEALAFTASQISGPVGGPLQAMVVSIQEGTAIEDALRAWPPAHRDRAAELFVGVLLLARRVGGDTPAILDGVAETLAARSAASREVASLTSQARLSATIIILLPLGFLGFIGLTSPADLGASLGTSLGRVAFVMGLLLDGVAFLWMRSLLQIRL